MSWTVKEKAATAGRYFLLFIFVSFLGWLGETIGCSIDIGAYCDRGFVNMPLCTIYGFTVLILYALLGTPDRGGVILKQVRNRWLRIFLYFVLGTVVATALEFAVGWFFADVLGAKLWDYSSFSRPYLSSILYSLGNTHFAGDEICVWPDETNNCRITDETSFLDIRGVCFAAVDRLGSQLYSDIDLICFHQMFLFCI